MRVCDHETNCKSDEICLLSSGYTAGNQDLDVRLDGRLYTDFELQSKQHQVDMCGILAILRSSEPSPLLRKKALQLSAKLRHRGPDWSGIRVQECVTRKTINVLAHERLAIVDPLKGAQPLTDHSGRVVLSVNGEIWNHQKLREEELPEYHFLTASDCEPLIPLYLKYGDEFIHKVDGIFALVISDENNDTFFAARDAIGVMSLYMGHGPDGSLWFASEMKALAGQVEKICEFPPGHFWSSESNGFVRWYNPLWNNPSLIPDAPADLVRLRHSLESSVIKRLMTDVPYGVLLSGGLDSSLVAAIVSRHATKREHWTTNWWPRVHTFSIGLEGAPDLLAAKEVADFLGTVHHEFHFTLEEGFDALSQVIYHTETYDVTTIRASTPMFLLARRIKAMGVKMVLSGEGADEVFGGYLYFHKAPNRAEFHRETIRKISLLSKYDCLRANKSTAAWGVESREPFLDLDFLDVAMSIDPAEKMIREGRIEKFILRKAFHDPDDPFLPDSVLWRQKEQFSDGVGYKWITGLKALAEEEVSLKEFDTASRIFPYNTPTTREAFFYRRIFHSYFPEEDAAKTVPGGPSIACSTPAAVLWDKSWKTIADPSGRAVHGVHVSDSSDSLQSAQLIYEHGVNNQQNGFHE